MIRRGDAQCAAVHRNLKLQAPQPLGDLIMTGPTGTNVNDLLFLLVA